MNKKIVIPTVDGSIISSHFGRAPYFAVVELDEHGNVITIERMQNTSDHFGGSGKPKDFLLALNPTVLIVQEIGPGALQAFEQAGVSVFRTYADNVEGAIRDYKNNELQKLDRGCTHSSHGGHHE
ncbi:NifB/NifX family molybdenum-iron cluster-binding protein [Thermotoga profunda]|uniref:NifB/NifX family molybdenum-iron cluster-binding protein n=1 Tax=Thermotoga profunda TaxID=1508420 RepID=UPI000693F83C|nr:NifB/NifX family molybdenum-iron cluster-binding protein [Thermotoga profunda]